MNGDTDNRELSEEDILACEVSDEEVERAATGRGAPDASSLYSSFAPAGCTCAN